MKMQTFSEVICALTHDISACDKCRKCQGVDGAEIRVNLINKLKEEIKHGKNKK